MASTEVLGEPRKPESDSLEREVLESETISSGGSPEDLLSAMTRTIATQIIDDRHSTSLGARYEVTHADEPRPATAHGHDTAPSPAPSPAQEVKGPATRIEIHNSGEADDRAGAVIHGRYQLVRMLGKGGMGTVYIAQHTNLPKTFAVKVLNSRYAKRVDIAQRFLQESQAVSMIDHENVVSVIDYGTDDDGTAFLVMEHLRGEPLSALCKREAPLPWSRVKHIMDQMCRALQAAHDVGIVHRDVKPENVLRVGRHGDTDYIKILDFGLAKMQVSGGLRLTQTGMVLGTPDYMSPEQARGRPADHRADIYASGVMMYELLAGKVPFSAKTFRAMRDKHLLEPPDPPSQKAPDAGITEEMDAIVLRALAKDPDHRFSSMLEMAEAIADVGTGKHTVPLIERGTMPLLAERNLFEHVRAGTARRGGTLPMTLGAGPASADISRAQTLPRTQTPAPAPASEVSVVEAPAAQSSSTSGAGLYLGLAALVAVLGLGAWAVLVGPFASQASAPLPAAEAETQADELAPLPVLSHATLHFETNVPVKVLDADGVPRFGDVLRETVLIPAMSEPIQLILRAEGYLDLHVVVTPDRDQNLRYVLEARDGTPPAAPPADGPVTPEPSTEDSAAPTPTPTQPKPSAPKPSAPKPSAPEPSAPKQQPKAPASEPADPPPEVPQPQGDAQLETGSEEDPDQRFAPEILDPFNN